MYGKKGGILLVCILIFLLTGCGGQDKTEEEEDEILETADIISDKYTLETFPVESGIRQPVLAGSRVYSVTENGGAEYTLYCMDIDSGETIDRAILWMAAPLIWSILRRILREILILRSRSNRRTMEFPNGIGTL